MTKIFLHTPITRLNSLKVTLSYSFTLFVNIVR